MKINGKYNKEDLERMILIENLSYREIGRRYGVSDAYIKKVCQKLDIKLVKRNNLPPNWVPHNKGKGIKKCLCCKDDFISTHSKAKFCSKSCEVNFKTKTKYEYYLNNQEEFSKPISMRFIKQHILKEQNNCCDICGIENVWNNKHIVLILDHINGDASDNKRSNLRLICPNCDSQLDTYKSKNKNSARKERYLLNYKSGKV
jgi:hypothetical protein